MEKVLNFIEGEFREPVGGRFWKITIRPQDRFIRWFLKARHRMLIWPWLRRKKPFRPGKK